MNYAGVDVVTTVLIFTVHNFRETRLQHYHEIHIFPFPTYHFHKYEIDKYTIHICESDNQTSNQASRVIMQWFSSDPTDSVLVFITWVWPAGPCHVSRAGRSDAVTWRVWRVRAAWRQAAHCRRTTTGLVSAAASVSASRTRPKPLPHTVTSHWPPRHRCCSINRPSPQLDQRDFGPIIGLARWYLHLSGSV